MSVGRLPSREDPDGRILRSLLQYVDFDRFMADHPEVPREVVEEYRRQSSPEQGDARADGPRLVLWVDGASAGNPGPAGIGALLTGPDGAVVGEIAEGIGRATNNVAEYRALLRGLEEARAHEPSRLEIRSDSELMVRQITGVYRVKDPELRRLHRRAMECLRGFESWSIQAIPREMNVRADRLSEIGVKKNAGSTAPPRS